MLKIEMGLTGISRKEVAGIIGECVDTKPVYKGGLNYQYDIDDWTVFMDTTVEPEKAEGEAGDDYKVGIGIPDSPEEELAGIFKALEKAKVLINDSCKLTVTVEGPIHGEKSKENLMNLFISKKEIILTAFGVEDGNIEVDNEKAVFQLFRATLDTDRITAYKHFCNLINQLALNLRSASKKKSESDNPKFTFRTFLIRLGMVGKEYKTTRKILLQNLEGNSAFRSGSKPEKVKDVTEVAVEPEGLSNAPEPEGYIENEIQNVD